MKLKSFLDQQNSNSSNASIFQLINQYHLVSQQCIVQDQKNKEYLYKDLYEDKAKQQGITMKQVLANEFEKQIENYKTYSTEDDVVITEINDILKYDVYEEVCSKLQLVVNKENYDKCKVLFENRSHL